MLFILKKKQNFHYNLNTQPIFNTTLINNNPQTKTKIKHTSIDTQHKPNNLASSTNGWWDYTTNVVCSAMR